MEINGKVYRNLEGQVGYLTDKYDDLQNQINDVRAHLTHYVEVDTLPTGDDIDTSAVYLLGPMGTAPDQYYEEWVYVQKADESWVWEKLGDTDSVDLSGYLEKVTTTTSYPQAYIKNSDGTQGMVDLTVYSIASGVPRRDANGSLYTTETTPNNNAACVSKKHADDNFVAKQTGTTTKAQAYTKNADGTQSMLDIDFAAAGNSLCKRDGQGRVQVETPAANPDAVNKAYADSTYLAKQTGVTTNRQAYIKAADGSQTVDNVSFAIVNGAIVSRTAYGQINVPSTPADATHAASKAYVDAAVGQLIYHHTMTINYTTVGTDYVKIAAHIDNNQSTPITAVSWNNMPIIEADYAIYHHGNTDYMCSVRKLPYGLHQDEFGEPRDGFMITFWNGSAWMNEQVNSSVDGVPTVTDVVTTW